MVDRGRDRLSAGLCVHRPWVRPISLLLPLRAPKACASDRDVADGPRWATFVESPRCPGGPTFGNRTDDVGQLPPIYGGMVRIPVNEPSRPDNFTGATKAACEVMPASLCAASAEGFAGIRLPTEAGAGRYQGARAELGRDLDVGA